MTASSVPTVEALLITLKQQLEAGSADAFERLAADLFCRVLGDVGVSVSKPGSQFGGDAGTAGLRGRYLRLECKRYKETTPLSPRSLAGEVLEAIEKDPHLEAWVLASTKTVSETERNLARDGGAQLGVPIVVIDWTEQPMGVGINAMAALCAKWPDIVEQHIGKVAGDAARALAVHAGSTAENLRRDLETWNIGFNHLRAISHAHLKKVWTESPQSLATLNQDAAGGRPGVHLIERKDALQALEAWWLAPRDLRSPAVVIGQEGVGKTWVSLDWLNRSAGSLPIVVPVPASTFLSHQDFSEAGVRDLLAQRLRFLAGSHLGTEYWRARINRILERPVAEGFAVLLLVDGINQHPTVRWEALAQALQADSLAGKVRILFTTRRHYFETSMRQFAGLDSKVTQVPVGAYSPSELEELLVLNGMNKADIPVALLNLASTPRLFPLIVRLKNSDALRADATVLRLMFEYGKDVHQVRTNSTLTDEAWVGWLGARALEYRDRLAKTGSGIRIETIKEVASGLADSSVSPEEVARRLSDVVDGDFFQVQRSLVDVKKFVLKEQPTVLGLGIALLESLEGGENTFEDVRAHAQKWLEPVGAIDESADVLRAALAILSALGSSDGIATTDALLVLWLNAQNPSVSIERDAFAFGDSFPQSMLTVIEHSGSGARSAAFHYAVQSLRRLPCARTADWDRISQRMLEWTGWVTLPDRAHLNDPNHYAKRHQEQLLTRIGVGTPGRVLIHGEPLKLDYSHPGDPSAAIPSILEGHDLNSFMPIIRRAAVREAVRVDFESRCWDGLRWVLLLASQNQHQARDEIARMADVILASAPETGVHPRLRNRIAACLLRLTGMEQHEKRALQVDETFGNAWDYDKDYLSDPGNSFFELEFRHLDQVLNESSLPVGRRLDKLTNFLAVPNLNIPSDLVESVKTALAAQSFERVDEVGMTTVEEHNLERFVSLAAKLAPAELAEMSRKWLAALAARKGAAKFWSALAAPEFLLVAREAEASAFSALRSESNADPKRDAVANAWCLQLELLHKPLNEQLQLLMDASNFYFLTNLVAVVRSATAAELYDFLSANEKERIKAANVVMQVMAYQVPKATEALAQELLPYLESEDKNLRGVAFVALASCSPELTGRALMSRNWKPDATDPWAAHYGSTAIVAATMHLDFGDVLPLIAPWRWLDAAVGRGGKPAELELATTRLLGVLDVPVETLPSAEGVLSVRVPKPTELAHVRVSEPPRTGDSIEELLGPSSLDLEGAQKRMDELAKDAAATIDKVRSSGHSLYLHTFEYATLEAAYKASPTAWEDVLGGAEARSTTFVRRVHLAEGLYLCLCEVLLAHAPAEGRRLWRALADCMKVRFNGLAKIPELVHIAMRAPDSTEVDAVRTELANLNRCNTDQDLFELVIVCQLYDRDTWLNSFIDADLASDQPWRHKRAVVLKAFHQMPAVDRLQWPEGEPVSSTGGLERKLAKWTTRGALAKHWWERFIGATDADAAFAAWHVFLGCADRRAWQWWSRLAKSNTELDRLRELQLESNMDLFARALEKQEEKAAKFADHLFGLDAPGKWLMMDGARAR
ncbi:hypothetical protein Q3O97_16580 [Ralstonia pseudosolanacearum]|uniref:hypothetical protein n=1 Tax=Ralstonia pseudosolanacearum TaxID=1310165 RepID=UPI00270C4D52|nr:hypothetical protein [Ralstonia pseudosolanacearum]MDO3617466.1 hypothetical protein [Ralstonia pseudosolanacearum]